MWYSGVLQVAKVSLSSDCPCKLAPGFVPMLDQMASLGIKVPEPPKCCAHQRHFWPRKGSEFRGLKSGGGLVGLGCFCERVPQRSQDLPRSGWWRLRDRDSTTCQWWDGWGSSVDRRPCAGVVWVVSPSRAILVLKRVARGRSQSIEVEIDCELFVSSHQGHFLGRARRGEEVQVRSKRGAGAG